MPAYSYKASTLEGKIIEGNIEASDTGAVSLKLQEMGLLPVRIGSSDAKSIFTREYELPWKKKRIKRKDLRVFTQELHTLVHAGIPLDRGLAVLGHLADNPAMAEVVQDVLKEVKGGKSFSEALAKYPAVFPKVYVSMVKAGEAGGMLNDVLARLALYLETTEELKSYIVGAMIYPALLSSVGLVSVTILMVFVVPRFVKVFKDMKMELPLPMKILDFTGHMLGTYWWVLLIILALVGYFLYDFKKSEQGRLKIDRWLMRIPLLGVVLQKLEVARFSRTLGTLLHGGVPLLQAMTIVRDIIVNQMIARTIDPIRNGIKKGEGITVPMKKAGVFPPLAMHLIEVGEESGRLDGMLLQVADTYDVEVRNSINVRDHLIHNNIKSLIAFFEPALILVMGIIIGTIVVSMLSSIFSIYDVPM